MKFWILIFLALAACQDRTVQYSPHRHQMDQPKLNKVMAAHVYSWEKKLASGDLLLHTNDQDFREFRDAVFSGVFDRNTDLSQADVKQIGSECTPSSSDGTIGIRRFERTLTMAPRFMWMTDVQGQRLADWLIGLGRQDLLSALVNVSSHVRSN